MFPLSIRARNGTKGYPKTSVIYVFHSMMEGVYSSMMPKAENLIVILQRHSSKHKTQSCCWSSGCGEGHMHYYNA